MFKRCMTGAVAVLLTACGPQIPVTSTVFDEYHGPVASIYSGDGALLRRYVSDDAEEFYSGAIKTLDPGGIYLMDMAMIVEDRSGVPFQKLRFVPRNMTPAQVAALPSYAQGFHRYKKGGPKIEFAARLPADRSLDSGGGFETDWTLCRECAGLNADGTAYANSATTKRLRDVAENDTRTVPFSLISFIDETTFALFDEETGLAQTASLRSKNDAQEEKKALMRAEKAAAKKKAQEEVAAAAEEDKRLYGDARRAYRAFADDYAGFDLAKRRKAECGRLKLRDPEPVSDATDATFEEIEYDLDQNEESYGKYSQCVETFLTGVESETVDPARTGLVARERTLWAAANLDDDDRIKVLTFDDAIDAEYALLRDAAKDYNASIDAYEKARDKAIQIAEEDAEYDRNQSRRQAASRKNAQYDRTVQECIALLMANRAFGPNSMSYCENEARKGVTGYGAALNRQTNQMREQNDRQRARLDTLRSTPTRTADRKVSVDRTPSRRSTGTSGSGGSVPTRTETPKEEAFPARFVVTMINETGQSQPYGTRASDAAIGAKSFIAGSDSFVSARGLDCSTGTVSAKYYELLTIWWNEPTRAEVEAEKARSARDSMRNIHPYVSFGPDPAGKAVIPQFKSAIGTTYKGGEVFWGGRTQFKREAASRGCKTLQWSDGRTETIAR